MKTAIIVMSDPATGSDEALGRVFNALAAASDFMSRGAEVRLLFQGAGTRWVAELTKEGHPAHALYTAVRDSVVGASAGCAAFFDATEGVVHAGLDLVSENPVPGTPGLPSLARLAEDGYQILTF